MTEQKRNLKTVVFDRMNELECSFHRQEHLDPDKIPTIEDQLAWVSKMWRILGEGDRDWIQCAQMALEDKLPWK